MLTGCPLIVEAVIDRISGWYLITTLHSLLTPVGQVCSVWPLAVLKDMAIDIVHSPPLASNPKPI